MAFLEITLKIEEDLRSDAAAVYAKYKQEFLNTVAGAKSKELLIRDEDVQVLHKFETTDQASDYLKSSLFTNDVASELKPFLSSPPDVRIYSAA